MVAENEFSSDARTKMSLFIAAYNRFHVEEATHQDTLFRVSQLHLKLTYTAALAPPAVESSAICACAALHQVFWFFSLSSPAVLLFPTG